MSGDDKRTEVICTKVSERMALDILRLASLDDRSVSEFVHLALREKLYGATMRLAERDGQSTK